MGITLGARAHFGKNGAVANENWIGTRTWVVAGGYQDERRSLRVTLYTDALGASEIRVGGLSLAEAMGNRSRLDVTESPTSYDRGDGGAQGVALHADGSGVIAVKLRPNATYYLWLFANGWSDRFGDEGLLVTASGSFGTAAEPRAADGCFGSAVPVTLVGGSAGARCTVTASCAGRTETLATLGTATSLQWTPALETYAALLPDAGSAPATLTVETFYAGASVGTRSLTITLRFPEGALSPTISPGWARPVPLNEGAAAGFTCFIQGYSRARVVFDETKIETKRGAHIAGYRVACAGESDTAAPYDTPVLAGSEAAIACTVVDSRALTATETLTVALESYARPQLTAVQVFRSDAAGAPDEDGNALAVRAELLYSSLAGENTCTLTAFYRPKSGGAWSSAALRSGELTLLPSCSADRSWQLRLEAEDGLGNTALCEREIPSRRWAMKFRPTGEGVAFGKAAEYDRALELPEDWRILLGTTDLRASLEGRCAALEDARTADLAALNARLDTLAAALAAQPVLRQATRSVTTDQYGQVTTPADLLGSGDVLLAVVSEDYRYFAVKQQGATTRVYNAASSPSFAVRVTLTLRFIWADYS